MKKLVIGIMITLVGFGLYGCNSNTEGFDGSFAPSVYTRDTSSGTRDGFMKGIGFDEASANESVLVSGFATRDNNGIMQAMTVDEYGIGYISLASLNNTVKGVYFNGVEPTFENVVNDTYDLKRPFMYMLRADDDFESEAIKEITYAFIAFLHSTGGENIRLNGLFSIWEN